MTDVVGRFPAGWPTGCPPSDAAEARGDVFRLVRGAPPDAVDMATHHETGRLPKADPCLRCGLSVFRDKRDAVHQRQLMPKLGPHVAVGRLGPEHGRAKLTSGQQPTHTTWWAYEGIARAALSIVVLEEG